MGIEVIDKVCKHLVSKPVDEWTDLTEIVELCRKHGLTDNKAKVVLDFLGEFFFEFDGSGRKARLNRSFYNLYRRDALAVQL